MVQHLASESDRLIVTMKSSHFSAEQLFDYFVTPDLLTQWWPPHAEIDPRAGGEYDLSWPRRNWHLRGSYGDFERGKRLTFTWHWDHEPQKPIRQVEIEFTAQDSGAAATLTHGFFTEDDAVERQGNIEGWLYFLDQLEKL